ncbi:MAG TPA: hypothetical protein VLH19_03425, partial [Patescibacteria group bacterium]|nr:hypothetical protein [Patescibacteria group bacterium]
MDTQTQTTPPAVPVKPSSSSPLLPVLTVLVVILLAVSGYLAFQNMQLKQQLASAVVPLASASPTPVATIDPTANWRLVQRKNWQFKLPPTWNYLECSDSTIFVGPKINKDQSIECAFDGSPGTIQISKFGDSTSFGQPAVTSPVGDQIVSEKSSIKVDGFDSVIQRVVITEGQGTGDRMVVYVTPKLTAITLHDIDQREIFNQFLSTFRFTNTTTQTGQSCPTDFTLYENSSLSLCRPSDMSSSSVAKTTTFAKSNEKFVGSTSFIGRWGGGACSTQTINVA